MRIFGVEIRRAGDAGETRSSGSIENPQVPVSARDFWQQLLGEWNAADAPVVSVEQALSVPAVWAAVNFIAGTIAALPLHEYRETAGGRERVENGMLAGILTGTVNDDFLTSFAWRKGFMVQVLLTGAGRTYVEKNGRGLPINLFPLETRRTTKKRTGWVTTYAYRDGGAPKAYQAHEVIDVEWMSGLDGVSVFNPLHRFRGTFGLAVALENYARRFFANGGVPPLVLHTPLGSPGANARAKTDTDAAIRKANEDRSNVLLMPVGSDLKAVGVDPEKGQMVEGRRFVVEEIARIFGLPPVFLQDLTHGTFSNTEQQDLHVVKHTLTQWVEAIEQQFNAKFYGPRATGRFVEFNLDGLLRGDFKTRMEGWARGVQAGIVKPNEARRSENRPDAPGGDRLYIQGATVPLEDAGKQPAATAPAPQSAPEADPVDDKEHPNA